jgi:hypothetical protein
MERAHHVHRQLIAHLAHRPARAIELHFGGFGQSYAGIWVMA